MRPMTLLELSGAVSTPARLGDAVLVVIDAQHEYVDGVLALPGARPALDEIGRLLERARDQRAPVVHLVHHAKAGALFLPGSRGAEIAAPAAPAPGEPVLTKALPNAFASTDLADRVHAMHRPAIIVVGFMTHMSVEATARGAIDVGLRATVVADATATRDLADPLAGTTIPAADVKRNSLAALADRFAAVVASVGAIEA